MLTEDAILLSLLALLSLCILATLVGLIYATLKARQIDREARKTKTATDRRNRRV